MIPQEKNKEHKWTNIILIVITIAILGYVAYIKGRVYLGLGNNVGLAATKELLTLDEKEKSFIGVNEKQIIKVTGDGIKAYDFDNTELWSDTFSMSNFVVKQKKPYIAVADKQGKTLELYNHKGKQCEITTDNPIVYFSVNENGGIATVESGDNAYTVTAYDKKGKKLCWRVSYTSTDGYPTAATLSPDNRLLLMSYVSVDDPQVTSSIFAMNVEGNTNENIDNIAFGYIESNNLVYGLEYINKDTWVCIGDKMMTWYDNNGNAREKVSDLSLVFVPELTKTSSFGSGYFPVIYSEKPAQNVVHRQDKMAYYDKDGKQTYCIDLGGGAEYYYGDEHGVVVEVAGVFKGYNKLCNQIFEYAPAIDVSKVIYVPSLQKGIAVTKDKVLLLTPKKENNK